MILDALLNMIGGWFSKKETVTQKLEKQFEIMQDRYEKYLASAEARFDQIEKQFRDRIVELEKSVCYRVNCVSRTNEYTVNRKKSNK